MLLKRLTTHLLVAFLAFTTVDASAASHYTYRVPIRSITTAPASGSLNMTLNSPVFNLTTTAGQTAVESVRLTNSGDAPLSGVNLTLNNSVAGLSLVDGCSGTSLAPGVTCTSQLRFTASTAGTFASGLLVSADGGLSASATIDLSASVDSTSARVTSMSIAPNSLEANGTDTATGIATVQDAYGNALGAGVTVQWDTTLGSFNPRSSTTNASGVASAILTASNETGTANTTAQVGNTGAATAQVTFTAPAASCENGIYPDSFWRVTGNAAANIYKIRINWDEGELNTWDQKPYFSSVDYDGYRYTMGDPIPGVANTYTVSRCPA